MSGILPPVIQKVIIDLLNKPGRFSKLNQKLINEFAMEFKVIDFSFIDLNSKYDLKWGWWSRVFEYELILEKLDQLNMQRNSSVHNTCWGYQGCHVLFKKELESRYNFVVNSDIQISPISNTSLHDLRKNCPENWENAFDVVLNVSTLEEIRYPHIKIFENLLKMVKTNGYLIVTFDVPGLQLDMFEKLFNRKINKVNSPVCGKNSPYRMDQFEFLNTGYFVIKKL
jgi:hypothetical protein